MFIYLYTVCILLLNIYSCKKQIHVDESVLQIVEMADSFRCYLGSMVVKCLQLTGMYEYGKESKPLPVSVKSNAHMLKSNMCTCLGRAWQVWMVPGGGGGGGGGGGETLTITFNVVIQFELCFGCRCFPLSCQWPKCEGMAPQ